LSGPEISAELLGNIRLILTGGVPQFHAVAASVRVASGVTKFFIFSSWPISCCKIVRVL
jgi:hypothetical protein